VLIAVWVVAAAACGDAESTATGAATANPDAVLPSGMTARQTMEARELHMKDLGGSFKSVKDQLKSPSPNLALIRLAAQEVQYASDDLPSWFPVGSGPETGVETRAFPEVWKDTEGFATAAKQFQTEAAALNETAKGSDLDAIQSRASAVGRTCGGCHDTYREEED
jgi:cytochrome c556